MCGKGSGTDLPGFKRNKDQAGSLARQLVFSVLANLLILWYFDTSLPIVLP
jgi:hypothetical protein